MPTIPPVGAAPVALGPEFAPPTLDGAAPAGEGGFGKMLADQIGNLNEMQASAGQQAQALATGKATDVTSVVMEIERASLALQLATQIRDKTVDAYHEIFRMQV
jgi:flagellar hook-basal body complex protein FliE